MNENIFIIKKDTIESLSENQNSIYCFPDYKIPGDYAHIKNAYDCNSVCVIETVRFKEDKNPIAKPNDEKINPTEFNNYDLINDIKTDRLGDSDSLSIETILQYANLLVNPLEARINTYMSQDYKTTDENFVSIDKTIETIPIIRDLDISSYSFLYMSNGPLDITATVRHIPIPFCKFETIGGILFHILPVDILPKDFLNSIDKITITYTHRKRGSTGNGNEYSKENLPSVKKIKIESSEIYEMYGFNFTENPDNNINLSNINVINSNNPFLYLDNQKQET